MYISSHIYISSHVYIKSLKNKVTIKKYIFILLKITIFTNIRKNIFKLQYLNINKNIYALN